jgi:hypothetical protein
MLDPRLARLRRRLDPRLTRLRGSRDEPARHCVYTRGGLPWPAETDLWHATTALPVILREGFRTRKQLAAQGRGLGGALGGRHAWSVSLTLDERRARSIALGLDVIARIARGELSCVELLDRLAVECPAGVRGMIEAADVSAPDGLRFYNFDRTKFRRYLARLDRGERCWNEFLGKEHQVRWIGPGETAPLQVGDHQIYDRRKVAYTLYARGIRSGSYADECFNPLFIGTDLDAMARVRPEDIGVIRARVDLPLVCVDDRGAIRLGYLPPQAGVDFLSGRATTCENDIENEVEGRPWHDPGGTWYDFPRAQRAGFAVKPEPPHAMRQTTLVFNPGEDEVRVFASQAIQVVDGYGLDVVRQDAGDRITWPWYEPRDFDLRVTRSCK